MSSWWWLLPGLAAFSTVTIMLVRRPLRERRLAGEYAQARRTFHQQRERLEAKFYQLAAASGKPRGLRWTNCDFADDVAYARDRQSSALCAFVGVTISFEAVAGGGMEEVEAVGNLRAATAVFRHGNGRWNTEGRAIFNLNPTEAIAYYQDDLVLVGQDAVS